MNTYNQSQQKTRQIENFLDALEQEESADDVPVSELEAGEAAYQEYLAGRDSGKSLEELKAKLG
ncbi:hypothetical protein C7B62_24655 [Pleurocapsa sp. CCALA 161]|uniref:hypothetical protein n=1 Tax=Pleurocapsa sp. CCALA 161 TaxID=2107688 RepID=UPI000D053C2E|nr:hypothetical protein [Pleurocapsa sp. CCALA 161]PSB05689.1 hypothetical protein C7B62_24655 [Pleurocapsa sp. CCALA 161]